MSGRLTLQIVLLSALATTACSDQMRNVTGPGNEASPDATRNGAVASAGDGSRIVRDYGTGSLSEFRFSPELRAAAVTWVYKGRKVATLDYGSAPTTTTSLQGGTIAFYDADGAAVALFDRSTGAIRSTSGSRIGALGPNDVDFDDATACSLALSGFFGGLTTLWYAIQSGRPDAPLLLPGIYAAWQTVAAHCNWLLRHFAYEFMHPIAQIGWK
jgi:hypothetical protein